MTYRTLLILAAFASCPGHAHAAGTFDIRLQCLPTQDPVVTTVRVEPGWSQSTGAECVYVSAHNTSGVLVSTVAVKSYPDDCVPAPEPGPTALGAGVIGLGLLARRRWGAGARFAVGSTGPGRAFGARAAQGPGCA